MHKIEIDFFSDTNTDIPSEIRKIMVTAQVGNEVAGEDPNVNKLIEKVCKLTGKESGLFLPSGTMCNVIAYKAHLQCPRRLHIT